MVNDKFTTSEGTSITDKNEIVEQFNKYFTNIGSSLNSKLPKTGEDTIQHIKHNRGDRVWLSHFLNYCCFQKYSNHSGYQTLAMFKYSILRTY